MLFKQKPAGGEKAENQQTRLNMNSNSGQT
jgi:hypothetical protein